MSERLNLVVDESQKERWQDYVDGTAHFSSVSDLIRTSVEKEIHSEDGGESPTLDVERELAQIKELLNEDVSSKLDEIKVGVKSIKDTQEDDDIEEFAKTVFHTLPAVPSEGEVEKVVGTKAGLEDTTLYQLSQRLNSTPREVAKAVEWLRDNGFPVVSYPLDGDLHYFEEE